MTWKHFLHFFSSLQFKSLPYSQKMLSLKTIIPSLFTRDIISVCSTEKLVPQAGKLGLREEQHLEAFGYLKF